MFSFPAILLYILFFVAGWLIARWRGAQQQARQPMAAVVDTPKPVSAKSGTPTPEEKGAETAAPAILAPSAKSEPASKPSVSKAADVKTVDQPAAKGDEAKKKAKTKPKTAKAASKPVASSDPDKPERLTAPRDGAADDLKKVKGIGPANEKKLNSFGIYHFDQIANWSAGQAEWIGKELSFPGRIEREDWIEQAKVLASGGDTEFSKRSDKR